ncbi:hypothetical protein ACIBSW_16755 [Actinoplanes sp. NPDC049668]|uniref:hypothetical protein n=1 Tax=unclassified Actinoplanes TaxID=2626549 RepID=UPI00339F3D5A
MYNLLVGLLDGEALKERVVEYTDDVIREYISPGGRLDPSRLVNLPTLVMPEIDYADGQGARIGHVESIVLSGRTYRFRFVSNPAIPEIPLTKISTLSNRLGITDWEFRRTHWAVKDVDLYRTLHEAHVSAPPASEVLRFPVNRPQEADLVAIMMPFDARFGPVYEVLREATTDVGLRCYRADDIWEHNHIMDDVTSLIWRSRVVISDLTGKNPNVFYETGIAHSIGRDVIQIAQSSNDVPFDLRSIRSICYLSNNEGLGHLKKQVSDRLRDLVSRPSP